MPTTNSAARAISVTRAGSVQAYLQAARIKSFWISSICVLSGAAVAFWQGHFDFAGLFLAWLGAVALQGGTNLTNVYYNYKSAANAGANFDPKGSAAPVRNGQITPANVRKASIVCFAVGVLAGVVLAGIYGWEIIALGVVGLIGGYFYAAPPVRLAYLGLGVITVFILMGPLMILGTYWVQTGTVHPSAVVVSVAVGLLAAGIMHINDVRDFESDREHSKHTLSTAVGRDVASWFLVAMNASAFIAVIGAVATALLPLPVLATLLTIPLAVRQARLVIGEREPLKVNRAWYMGVQLQTQFGLLLVAGLVAARMFGMAF